MGAAEPAPGRAADDEPPDVPLEAGVLTPDRLAGADDVAALPLWHGKERTRVGEFFAVSGSGDDVRLEGDLTLVHSVGAGMSAGRLTVAGSVGMHAGAGMRGGELHVQGDAGDLAGAGMHGGTLVVRGSAGRRLGGAYAGERAGMRGGEIVVHGDAGEQAGAGLRRGLIAVGGRAGEAAGLRMLAGTIVDNSGVTRTKVIPVARLRQAVESGVGLSPVFAVMCADDGITESASYGGPAGDMRLVPDLAAAVLVDQATG